MRSVVEALIDAQMDAFMKRLPMERLRGRVGSAHWRALGAWLASQNEMTRHMGIQPITPAKLFGMPWVEDPTLAPEAVVVEEREA